MIGYFAPGYPDELLYSICARTFDRLQPSSKRQYLESLFGENTATAIFDLPGHLETFVANLPMGNNPTINGLIAQNTLLPLYRPFIPEDRVIQICNDMKRGSGNEIHMRSGVMAGKVNRQNDFCFCQLCVEEDKNQYGECYWHRSHQAPGVLVCYRHNIWLDKVTLVLTRFGGG
jgi:hypothetical protein